jgi:transcriptional regulator with XRE-family HTH domain
MTGAELKLARTGAGWTQTRLAEKLGVTQAYLSLLEGGKRRLPDRVQRAVTRLLRLSPTCLPLAVPRRLEKTVLDARLEQGLARLGYPGLAYLRTPGESRNPGEILLMALSADDLDPRLAESLPWLLLRFDGLRGEELFRHAKLTELQNRLGFTISLARRVAECNPRFSHRQDELKRWEELLEPSRLAREDTYGRKEKSERMRTWLRENRSADARHWNLLTDLKPEHLPYADPIS